mgnify:CR=1 FL=1
MTHATFEFQLQSTDQQFVVVLNSVRYIMRIVWNYADNGGWTLDINTDNNAPLVCGIPLVTGADLLGQYEYLEIGGYLYCYTDGQEAYAEPTHNNLGSTSHLVFQPYD